MAALSTYNILTLGKSPQQLELALQAIAPQGFTIVEADDPEQCLKSAKENHFDLTLLQIQKDTDEIKSLCSSLKKNKTTKKIPIIVSAKQPDNEDIFSVYDMGVFDILSYDISPSLLQRRIELAFKIREEEIKLQKKLDRAKETAFDAMADSSELGQVITFLNATANTTDYAALATQTFQTMKALGTSGSLVFHSKDNDFYFSDDDTEKPIEFKLMKAFNSSVLEGGDACGRFKTFSNRIVITSRLCSLLVRNAPDDETKQGRLRDILGALINGLEARATTIEVKLQAEINRKMGKNLFCTIENAMIELGALFKDHEHSTIEIMDNLMHSTQEGLSLLGLTEEQEEYFMNSIESAMASLITLYTKGIQFDNSFQNILHQLNELSTQL